MLFNKVGICGSGERATGPRSARLLMAAAVLLALAPLTQTAHADFTATTDTVSANPNPVTHFSTVINTLIGADRFYNIGDFGQFTLVANVEAGYVWNGQESLTQVNSYISNSPLDLAAPQYDWHATMVGGIMVSLGPANPDGSISYVKLGISPLSQLTSVAIATQWDGDGGQFEISSSTLVYGYRSVMQSGDIGAPRQIFPGVTINTPVDVVNSSWGYADANATQQPTLILDALAAANHQTVCVAAGNHNVPLQPGEPTTVGGPASGFNTIAVAALAKDTDVPPFQSQADFSAAGPNDFFNPATGQTIHGVRAAVSIAAPGQDFVVPAYIGHTGGNTNGTFIPTPDPSVIDPADYNKLYFFGVDGTSFASPTVAGGANLLVTAGYGLLGGGPSVDGRVIKAVLLNSADKTPGWTNNTQNIGGVLTTSQGLDWNVGAGALDLNHAYDQYLSGTTNAPLTGGTVQPLGWAFGHVTKGVSNNYLINTPLHSGDTFTVTLDWFINTFFNANATADPTTDNFSDTDLHQTYFDQLDLQVWLTDGLLPTQLIADSTSPYNNTDHLYFTLPQDGTYAIVVSYLGTTYDIDPLHPSPHADDYGLAWSDVTPTPEPTSLLLLALAFPALSRPRKRFPLL